MERTDLRAAALLAPVMILGLVAVSVVAAVAPLGARIALDIATVLCVSAAIWRAGALSAGERAPGAVAPAEPPALRVVGRDRRLPIFDRDGGAYSAWYFRLRAEEEIARAERFGERFSIVTISGTPGSPLNVGEIADAHWLREVDFAGNLGSVLAVALPKTGRNGAQIFVNRMMPKLGKLDVRISEYPADGKTLDALLGEDEWRAWQPPEEAAA